VNELIEHPDVSGGVIAHRRGYVCPHCPEYLERPTHCPNRHEMDWLTDRVGVCHRCDAAAWFWNSAYLTGEFSVTVAQLVSVLIAYRDGTLKGRT